MTPDLPPAGVRSDVELTLERDGVTHPARMLSFTGLLDPGEHVAVVLGTPRAVPLVRVHSECLTGDVLGSQRCDCGPQLHESIARLARPGGYLLYLRQEGRGIGLYNKLDAYRLQDRGLDTYEANRALGFGSDDRDYAVAVQMLRALGVLRVELLTHNPDKVAQLESAGIEVVRTRSLTTHLTASNGRYLAAKRRREAGRRERLLRAAR